MTQSTPHTSSSYGSDSSNAAQSTPNTGMYMAQFPWPQPVYIPHPGCAPAHLYYPYGVPPNGTHGAAPPHAPVAPSPGVGAGVAHHAFPAGQKGYYPSAVVPVSHATYVCPYPPLTYALPIPHQGYPHQRHGPRLATGSASSSLPQAPGFSVGKKRVAEDLQDRDVKRTKICPDGMKNDPLFKPLLDQHGQPNGTFVCSKDGKVLNSESYLKHLRTNKHLGLKQRKFKCPGCSKSYSRRDACKRHWDESCGKLAADGAGQSYSAACKRSMRSASAAPVTAPTTGFAPPAACVTQWYGTPSFANPALCLSQSPENNTVAVPAEDDGEDDDDDNDDPDFWEANEIKDVDEM
ncbi:hypothetical protein F4604DRAFT_1724843 [Suillus subluteus]|nr:hypothetical protein F4604DRAFT_1724843 [Suillus subluteus]